MRRKQYFSRAVAFVLATVMLLSTSTTAFAMGTDVTTDYINQETSSDITLDSEQGENLAGEPSGENGEDGYPVASPSEAEKADDNLADDAENAENTDLEQMMPSMAPTLPTQEPEFDVAMPFTLADLSPYNVEMETAEIDLGYFKLEGENENHDTPCQLHFDSDQGPIRGGYIKSSVPPTVVNDQGAIHAFCHAHVGDTKVYYMGKLTIYDEDGKKEYIYYTTDTEITNKTVYAVLKNGEQISLVYDHGSYVSVEYEFQNEQDQQVERGPDGLSVEDVFGKDCAYTVPRGNSLSVSVTIPRGYTAQAVVYDADGNIKHTGKELGRMMEYSWDTSKPNTITPVAGNDEALLFSESFSVGGVNKDLRVVLNYNKIDSYQFNAYFWSQSSYANRVEKRIQIVNDSGMESEPNTTNCKVVFNRPDEKDHNFTWMFNGMTYGSGQARYTYEMDQLEINGESIHVPMTSLNDDGSSTAKTVLKTGTVITLTVDSLGGVNAGTGTNAGRRAYTLEVENCYEDLTITGGNMVGHIHKEYAVNTIFGIADPQYWPNGGGKWGTLKQNTLIDRRNGTKEQPGLYGTEPYVTAPFRFKLAEGYENLHVTFTSKEKVELQTDGTIQYGNKPLIEYLTRTDTSSDTEKGEYTVVPYDQWQPSEDGYYYCRATMNLKTDFMDKGAANGVILLHFYADPVKSAIDYRNGAGDGTTNNAPSSENISNMPEYQDGGKNGYNISNNATALVSNRVPLDKNGKFVFDHWEILTVEDNQPSSEVKTDESGQIVKIMPGEDIHVTEDMLEKLNDCVYFDGEKERNILTLQAVWRPISEKESIPYTVQYILADVGDSGELVNQRTILERTHTVNVGAMLVTDLYQIKEGHKVVSESIQAVLEGDNEQGKDYTLEANWLVREPETTRMIERVTIDNNVAKIYLVKKTAEVTVNKVWVGDETTGTRPESIQVQLYKGEEPVGEPVTLTKEMDWRYTFKGLDEIENGQPIVYTAKEVQVPNGYTVDVAAEGHQITITNTKEHITPIATGSLKVSKIVSGSAGSTTTPFNFTVELDDKTVTGEYGAMHFENGVATFELKHGGSMTATGLPAGIRYKVTETEANQDGYTTGSVGAEGTIDVGHEAGVSFTNHKDGSEPGSGTNPTDPKGNLTITKTVSGAGGDLEKEFTFTVTLTNSSITGQYGDLFFEDGKAVFTLKHDESVEAIGLPAGIGYTVEESEDKDYSVTKSGDEGTIEEGKTSIVLFNNEKKVGGGTTNPPNPDKPNPDKPNPDKPNPDKPTPDKPNPPDPDRPNPPAPPAQEQPGLPPVLEQPNSPASVPSTPVDNTPQTGDGSHLSLWLALLGISGVGLLTTLAASRRKYKRAKK